MEDLADWFNPPPIDPLVIDMDGDGVELTSLEGSNAFFDLDGDGLAERTAWVAPDDALLAVDSNQNGSIDDISEVFGSENATGYQELAGYDTNGDGVIDIQDDNFEDLLVWQDLNGNGTTEAGELQSLDDAGIASLDLAVTATDETIEGNAVVGTSVVNFEDGTTTISAEVLFEMSQVDSQFIAEDFVYAENFFTLPYLRGFGNLANSWVEITQNAELEVMAQNAISAGRTGDFDGAKSQFEAYLLTSAGVNDAEWIDDVHPDSYSFWYAYSPCGTHIASSRRFAQRCESPPPPMQL